MYICLFKKNINFIMKNPLCINNSNVVIFRRHGVTYTLVYFTDKNISSILL